MVCEINSPSENGELSLSPPPRGQEEEDREPGLNLANPINQTGAETRGVREQE